MQIAWLAWPLDESERAEDGTLAELSWAETIVRVEAKVSDLLEHLRQEIQAFPAEFLLFFPVTVLLKLDDGAKPERELKLELEEEETLLSIAGERSRWRVAKRDVSITNKRTLEDATHIHARKSAPIAWAIPLDARRDESGRFWAFFSTQTPTYLPGILNAPWKLNSDRNAIIGGEWNTALMQEAARLIADTLPLLRTKEDPARHLDAFPRQLERKDEDAAPLIEAIWKSMESAAVIPDGMGLLRNPLDLWRHPLDNAKLAEKWQDLANNKVLGLLVHSSCLERQRSSRLNVLAEWLKVRGVGQPALPALRRQEVGSWFGGVASTETSKAIQVLMLAESYQNGCLLGVWSQVRPLLAIIPTQDNQLLAADKVVLAPIGVTVPNRATVASKLCNDVGSKRILESVMRVKPLDDSVWESVLLESLNSLQYSAGDGWKEFWNKVRVAPESVQKNFLIQRRFFIRVRRKDMRWTFFDRALLPGTLVNAGDTSSNQNLLIDSGEHLKDGQLLECLGVCENPTGTVGPSKYEFIAREDGELSGWVINCRNIYRNTCRNSALSAYLEPLGLTMPNGWHFLSKLVGIPNAILTRHFLDRIKMGEFTGQVDFGHSSVARYQIIKVQHPLPKLVLTYGKLQAGNKTACLSAVVARRQEPALSRITNWDQIQPALEKLEQIGTSNPATNTDIRELWLTLIEAIAEPSELASDRRHLHDQALNVL